MVRTKFEEQLNELNREMLQMGMYCETSLKYASESVLGGDKSLAALIPGLLEQMNQEDKDIESTAMKILLMQQPVAGDLRYVSSAMKIVTDMKRIGIQSNDIGEIVTMDTIHTLPGRDLIRKMSDTVISMVSDSVDAFAGRKLTLAKDIIKRDDIADSCFDEIKQVLIGELRKPYDADDASTGAGADGVRAGAARTGEAPASTAGDGDYGAMILDILMVAKYLERIGDHAVNIAGWVCYFISGKREGLK